MKEELMFPIGTYVKQVNGLAIGWDRPVEAFEYSGIYGGFFPSLSGSHKFHFAFVKLIDVDADKIDHYQMTQRGLASITTWADGGISKIIDTAIKQLKLSASQYVVCLCRGSHPTSTFVKIDIPLDIHIIQLRQEL